MGAILDLLGWPAPETSHCASHGILSLHCVGSSNATCYLEWGFQCSHLTWREWDNTELVREWQPLAPVLRVTQCLILILPYFGFPWHRYWHLTYITPAIITWSNNSRFLIAWRTCYLLDINQLNILPPELVAFQKDPKPIWGWEAPETILYKQ